MSRELKREEGQGDSEKQIDEKWGRKERGKEEWGDGIGREEETEEGKGTR